MTMHLVKGMSSLNTRKRKQKATKAQIALWTPEWRADNKWRKRMGMPTQTFDEYVEYRLGKAEKLSREFVPLEVKSTQGSLDEHRKKYPSKEMSGAPAVRQEPKVYSGERKLLGIATLHKSNMVPVFDKESAIDIARMRRN